MDDFDLDFEIENELKYYQEVNLHDPYEAILEEEDFVLFSNEPASTSASKIEMFSESTSKATLRNEMKIRSGAHLLSAADDALWKLELPSSVSSTAKTCLPDRPQSSHYYAVITSDGSMKYVNSRRSITTTSCTVSTTMLAKSLRETNADADKKLAAQLSSDSHYLHETRTELLSPEKVNREVLHHLKQWDSFVFRKNVSNTAPPAGDENEGTSKHDTRPQQKVILLAGPPGTGKTSLAHIIARHCGYRALEINASDDRSADILKDHLARAMSSNTIHGDKRPNCIILDEIDGIDSRGSIDMLLKIINAPLHNKKKTTSFALTRPLICICNDQYAPALRELRKTASVFVFHAPSAPRLVQRLKEICIAEKIRVGPSALGALYEASAADIRSAINTLQFATARVTTNKSENIVDVTGAVTNAITTGLKDERQDAFQVWREALSSKHASESKSKNIKDQQSDKGKLGMYVFSRVSEYGDTDLMLSGIRENFLHLRYTDPNFTKSASSAEWISFVNTLVGSRCSGDSTSTSLEKYVPLAAAAIHVLCAADYRVKVMWPMKEKSHYFASQQRRSILQCLSEGARVHAPALSTIQCCAVDCISYIYDCLCPALSQRASAMQTLSEKEKRCVLDTAQRMVTCGLSYTTITTTQKDNTITSTTLDPAIHELLQYTSSEGKDSRRVSVSAEFKNLMYLECRRLKLTAMAHHTEDATASIVVIPSPNKRPVAAISQPAVATPPITETPVPKKPKVVRMDFFAKRATKPSTAALPVSTAKAPSTKPGVHFKFNQGHSNAVRRSVLMREFLV